MKNKKRGTVIVSALFAVLCLAQTASAFYAPNHQRWVNRDPIGDRRQQLYHFVRNNPLTFVDYRGHWHGNGRKHEGKDLSIVCDGKGGVRIYYPPGYDPKNQSPCIGTCLDEHENCHKATALNANPDVCKGQRDGTQIEGESWEDVYEDEIRCSQATIDCLDDCKDPCPKSLIEAEKTRIKNYQEKNKKLLKDAGGSL